MVAHVIKELFLFWFGSCRLDVHTSWQIHDKELALYGNIASSHVHVKSA